MLVEDLTESSRYLAFSIFSLGFLLGFAVGSVGPLDLPVCVYVSGLKALDLPDS